MIFWHLGASIWLFRWIFRDPKVDLRFLALGALVPDLIDMPIGTVLLGSSMATGELWAHSLLAPTLFVIGVLLATRRGRRRRAWMALGVGWLFHLLLDGMWLNQEVFLWPFFGFEITPGQVPYWSLAIERAFSDLWRWILEAVGIGYVVWLARASRLNELPRRRQLLVTGRINTDET